MHIKALEALGGLDVLGSPKVDNHDHAGWGWAGISRTKARSSSRRTSVGPATRWRFGGRRRSSRTRHRAGNFIMSTTLSPTIYEVLGISPPREVHGIAQDQIDGASFAYSFDDPHAPGRLLTDTL